MRTVRVRVRGAYEPSVLHARVGEPVRIVFSREETAACSEHVVFPAFGRSAMLPPYEDVALVLRPERAGEFDFTCQLGLLRGRLIVTDERSRRRAPRALPDGVVLTAAAWLCSLPLLLLVTVPLVGWRAGGALGAVWLAALALVCVLVRVTRRAFVDSGSRGRGALHTIRRPRSSDLRRVRPE